VIAVECNADVKLVRILGVGKREIRHEGCKGNIFRKLKKEAGGTGLVDKDPGSAQPSELGKYRKVEGGEGIELYTHQDAPNKRVIVLCPRLEEWLYQRAKAVGVKPEDFGLEKDARALHRSGHYEKRKGYVDFINELRKKDVGMKRLEEWVGTGS